MNNDPINSNVNPVQSILDQNWSMTYGYYARPTVTLATTFLKPVGQANPYFCFEYGPQKICYDTQEQLSESINADMINVKVLCLYTLAMAILNNKCACCLISDYIRTNLISYLYPLLWPFSYFVGGGGQ